MPDRNAGVFRRPGQVLDIAADDLLRTTEERHRRAVRRLWRRLRPWDLLYRENRP